MLCWIKQQNLFGTLIAGVEHKQGDNHFHILMKQWLQSNPLLQRDEGTGRSHRRQSWSQRMKRHSALGCLPAKTRVHSPARAASWPNEIIT